MAWATVLDGQMSAAPATTAARRVAEWLLTVSAVGEISVGLLGALLPGRVMELLLGAPVEGTGVIGARMMGIAVAS